MGDILQLSGWIITSIEIIMIIYVILLLLFVLFFNNNILFWRSRKYTIPYGKIDGEQIRKELSHPKIVYWVCKNSQQKNPDDWVIMLHSWGRNSGRMVKRAKVWWDLGFSLIFIDARSHGQSAYWWTSQGFIYGYDAIRVSRAEGLKNPILHGLSVGAIASTVYAHYMPVRALVLEALVNNYRDMVYDTIRLFHLPMFLFKWISDLLLSINLPFEEYRPDKILPNVNAPIFLIHGENDTWFRVEKHYNKNMEALKDKNVTGWIVPGSKHSKMALNPNYNNKLRQFIISKIINNQINTQIDNTQKYPIRSKKIKI